MAGWDNPKSSAARAMLPRLAMALIIWRSRTLSLRLIRSLRAIFDMPIAYIGFKIIQLYL